MSEDPKKICEDAYDAIADWYLQWQQSLESSSPRRRYAELVLQAAATTASPRFLEHGCGAGVPITRMFLDRGAKVVANDLSSTQTAMAKAQCPEAEILTGDMTTLAFPPTSFDGAACFYAIFHLPRAEQKPMLASIYAWLKPGSMFVCNFATEDEEEIHGEMMGHGMFWSSFGTEDSKAMLTEVGFEIVLAEVVESGDGKLDEDDPDYGVKFLWIAASKGAGQS